jgi:diguanylate cyclase (GGDEF)-like protein/PAS domain S-box-containing protein
MPPSLRPNHVLAAILSSATEGLLSFSLDGTIDSWSSGAQLLYGYRSEEIKGCPISILLPIYEVAVNEEFLRYAKEQNLAYRESTERLRKDGSRVRVIVKRCAVRDDHGEITGFVETAREEGWQAAHPGDDEQLRRVVDQMPAMLWTTDCNLRITSNFGAGFGPPRVQAKDLVGKTLYEYLKCQDPHAAPIAHHAEALRGASSCFEYHHGSRFFAVHLRPLRGPSGEITGCIGAGMDITDRKKHEDQIRYQATHDALTGLANYREFVETLEREVRRAARSNKTFSVLLLDLDELKAINDKYGHLAGNRALKRLSGVIKDHSRTTDLAARYGGDEFAVVLIDADPGMANHIAERIERAMRDAKENPPLTVSIGISVYPQDGRTAAELLEAADQKLYKRKKMAHTQSVSAG